MSDELKPCWLCGGKGEWDELGGYCFVKCKSPDCKNSKPGHGVDGHFWQRGGVTEVGALILENERLQARVTSFRYSVEMAEILIEGLLEYAECNDPGSPYIGKAKAFLSQRGDV